MNRLQYLAVLVLAGGLNACSNDASTPYQRPDVATPAPPASSPYTYQPCDSGSGSAAPAATDAAADGIWQGTLTNELLKATEPWTAVVAADGRFRLMSTGPLQMAGTLTVDGNAYTGEGIADAGSRTWHDGTPLSELSVAGTLAERDRLAGDFTLASGDAGCFSFVYDADLYERPSSLDRVAGTWIDYDGWGFLWLALEVTADGQVSGQDIYGCSHSGSIALLDERFNLYAVTLEIREWDVESYPCWGPGSYEGFAYLADTGDGASADHYLNLALADGDNSLRITIHR